MLGHIYESFSIIKASQWRRFLFVITINLIAVGQ